MSIAPTTGLESADQSKQLARAVREMRDWQKKYFRDRDSRTLDVCKLKEREVDTLIETMFG